MRRRLSRSPGAGRSKSLPLECDYPDGGLPARLRFGGWEATLRPLQAGDEGRLIAFFQSHQPETIRNRYGYLVSDMSPERAAGLVGVDQAWDAALGVFKTEGAEEVLVAVGRACREPAGDSAEVAFVVREDCRRRGIATALFRSLATLMRRRGVTRLVAQVQQDNVAMLDLFRKTPVTVCTEPGTGALQVSLPLGEERPPVGHPPGAVRARR